MFCPCRSAKSAWLVNGIYSLIINIVVVLTDICGIKKRNHSPYSNVYKCRESSRACHCFVTLPYTMANDSYFRFDGDNKMKYTYTRSSQDDWVNWRYAAHRSNEMESSPSVVKHLPGYSRNDALCSVVEVAGGAVLLRLSYWKYFEIKHSWTIRWYKLISYRLSILSFHCLFYNSLTKTAFIFQHTRDNLVASTHLTVVGVLHLIS